METHKIIQASSRDYPELIKVWESSVRATHYFLSEEDIAGYKHLILNEYFKNLKLFYINKNTSIIGFIGLNNDLIQMLFIHPKERGTGIGKSLIDFAIRNFSIKKVDVNEQNKQAVGFYLHMGFKTIERSELDAAGKPFPILSMELNQLPMYM